MWSEMRNLTHLVMCPLSGPVPTTAYHRVPLHPVLWTSRCLTFLSTSRTFRWTGYRMPPTYWIIHFNSTAWLRICRRPMAARLAWMMERCRQSCVEQSKSAFHLVSAVLDCLMIITDWTPCLCNFTAFFCLVPFVHFYNFIFLYPVPLVLKRCWLGGKKGIWPVKTEW